MFRLLTLALGMAGALATAAHAATPISHITDVGALAPDAMAAVDETVFDAARFTARDGSSVPYRVLPPQRIEPGRRYPLVIQLHSSGGIGTDNRLQLDRMAKSWALPETRARYPAFVLVPQFAERSAHYGPPGPDQHATAAPVLAHALELARDFAAHHPVDTARIYATGFSMGGSAAWLAPTLDDTLLAAIVPFSGIAPADDSARTLRQLPVLIVHGDADDNNPITADHRFFLALQRAGNTRVQFRQYQGLAHQPPADIQPGRWWRDWLFAQRRK
ncbi:prolyl oligopeptidase family serine peptidase [Stenotrophomonas sp. 24(2023)]|uniref:carboxylesterase family protein n=1 Tax=Stenotrophomonas sp. 24(2023) TaxID=3068324 RepID=UPI0027E1337E|nr:prolyl oligopeptidase family serine peptidase [Stenotrophomonas sp. 24(2023)]WMJ68078.1 prolyl oligopeptidase family serine peptidase [Stenotrophomonas sp. 24(2023)]